MSRIEFVYHEGMANGKEIVVGSGGVRIERFWKDNGNKVLAVTAAGSCPRRSEQWRRLLLKKRGKGNW